VVGPGLVRARARVGVGNAQVQARGARRSVPENGCTQRSTEAMSLSVAPTRARLDGPCEAKEWKTSHSMSRLKPTNQHTQELAPRPLTISREQTWSRAATNWRSSRVEARHKTTLLRRTVRRPGIGDEAMPPASSGAPARRQGGESANESLKVLAKVVY